MRNVQLLLIFGVIFALVYLFAFRHQINWSREISTQTVADSWGTWRNNFSDLKPGISREDFIKAVKTGEYKLITLAEFLKLNIENNPRLYKYPDAKTPQEAYPESDRPRGHGDINSVNFFMRTREQVSPIVVARVSQPSNHITRLIKLDGVHRLVAAQILGSKIKVLFVDL